MASHYYVNKNAQDNGDHEVHRRGCSYFPDKENARYVGKYNSCFPAVAAAKKIYATANGCYYCSNRCHTT